MDTKQHRPTYAGHYKRGPFPGRIDPWAEVGKYFGQIHGGLISHVLEQIQHELLLGDYIAGIGLSLQVAERGVSDLPTWWEDDAMPSSDERWDYAAAADEVEAEAGFSVTWDEPNLTGIFIKDTHKNTLVTLIEVVSPSSKIDKGEMADYRERRERLLYKGVNLVEIDLTRSVKRCLDSFSVTGHAYHVAVYLPHHVPRLIPMDFGQRLKQIALPLYREVLPLELQAAYDYGYQSAGTAAQIQNNGDYMETDLPFPSLLTEAQRQEALAAVTVWQAELERLRTEA